MARRDGELRARDVDRAWVMARVDEAFTDGQLTVDEHLERIARARSAVTIAELDAVLGDLQLPDVRPAAHRRARWRTGAAVALAVVVAVIAVVTGVVAWRGSSTRAPTGVTATVGTERLVGGPMFAQAGMDEVVRALRTKFGTTVIEGVHFYRDRAIVRVPEAASPVGGAWYTYSLGGAFHDREVYGGLSVSSDPALRVDLARLDTRRLAELIAAAPGKLGISDATVPATVPFRVTVGGDDGGQVWMGVNAQALDSHLVAGLDGTIFGVHRCGWGC